MPYGRDPARDSYRRLRAAAHEDEGGMDMTHVLLEKKEHIAVATINRPKALNALNSEVLSDLDELVDIVTADQDIYALIITGSGEKAFVAGADIAEMSTLTKEGGEAFSKHGNDVFRRIETLPIPTIAAAQSCAVWWQSCSRKFKENFKKVLTESDFCDILIKLSRKSVGSLISRCGSAW